jgi:hypothetical protein
MVSLCYEDGSPLYRGRGTPGAHVLTAIAEGRAYVRTEEDRISLFNGELSELHVHCNEMDDLAQEIGGRVTEVIIEKEIDDSLVRTSIDVDGQQPRRTRQFDAAAAAAMMETIHNAALRGRPSMQEYEETLEEACVAISAAFGNQSRDSLRNVVPGQPSEICHPTLWVFPGAIPADHQLQPHVGEIQPWDSREVPQGDSIRRNRFCEWETEYIGQREDEFVSLNFEHARESSCLDGWNDIHVFMLTETRHPALDGFIDALEESARRTGRTVDLTIHYPSHQQKEVIQ